METNTTTPINNSTADLEKKIRANKTPLLIIILAILTGILLIVALSPKAIVPITRTDQNKSATPAETTLSFGKATSTGSQDSVDVIVNTGKATATAVQLEMTFDPKLISNIKIEPGNYTKNWGVLLNKVDYPNGRITYALGVPLSGGSVKGTGSVANITFTEIGAKGQTIQINLLPRSLVSIEGFAGSSLKSTSNFTKVIGETTSSTPTK
jgi:hypothetical protein